MLTNGISVSYAVDVVDSKVPDSSARFMPRKQNHVLQMQMDAFRFHEDHRNAVSPI